MRKIFFILVLAVFLISAASAEIIIRAQPNAVYNLGEVVSVPVTVKTTSGATGMFQMNLICEGHELNFYKNGVSLSAGGEKKMEPSLILSKTVIGEMRGICVIKCILGEEYVLTNEFAVSDKLSIQNEIKFPELLPNQNLEIKGMVAKESGIEVSGFVEAKIFLKGASASKPVLEQTETINKGFFLFNISIPKAVKAGAYSIEINAYEKDSLGEITNEGYSTAEFLVKQIPTNLEIITESSSIEPGASQKITIILHDQTGENINEAVNLKIKDSKGKILENTQINTSETYEFPVENSEPPSEFKISASFGEIKSDSSFSILQKEKITTRVINNTLKIMNIGNVPYCNKIVSVKIGENFLSLSPCIEAGEEETYTLTAPDGEYNIEIITDEDKISENVMLTGKAIDIQKASENVVKLSRYPFVWIFVVLIFGLVIMTIARKGYKMSFIGKIYSKKARTPSKAVIEKTLSVPKGSLMNKNLTNLELAIQGDRQKATAVCINVKNISEVKSNPEGVNETFSKIEDLSIETKSAVYENQGNIFLIFAPIKTRTFNSELTASNTAFKIRDILDRHNKLFRTKINYGISVGDGQIVAKGAGGAFRFMPIGDIMIRLKKMASISQGEVLVSEDIRTKFGSDMKVEKISREGISAYKIINIKEKQDHEKFIQGFMERMSK